MENGMKKRRFCSGNRCILSLFVLVVLSVVAVCCITFLTPSLRVPSNKMTSDLTWWQKAIVYQIYPRSFQDSNGDGTGDLKGIASRLPYLKELGVGAVWLSPFYKSPMVDFGYDVSDYIQVDPLFGTLEDFDDMVKEAHRLGLKIIVDFVPNHTSDQHDWFQLSRNRTGKYTDYYIWSDGKLLPDGTRLEPNNWKSTIRGSGSAWQWDSQRRQYYYHAYLKEQPDLNHRNPDVCEEMDTVLRFWLDRGVDGFRIDAITQLFEVEDLSLEVQPGDKDQIGYRFTLHQPEIFDAIKKWKSVLDEYESKDGNVRWLVAEANNRLSADDRHNYYQSGSTPFFFDLVSMRRNCNNTIDAKCVRRIIQKGTDLNDGEWPNFVMGNHDNSRVSNRIGHDLVDAMNMLLLTLPGTPTTYYGEEIGMRNGNYTGMRPKDTFAISRGDWSKSRDPELNPMQWNSSVNAGFSSAPPDQLWLPITDNTHYETENVEMQSKDPNSTLSIYKRLAALRQDPAFLNANIEHLAGHPDDSNILAYSRSDGTNKYVVVINFGTLATCSLDRKGIVKVATKWFHDLEGQTVGLSDIVLGKGDGLVLKLL